MRTWNLQSISRKQILQGLSVVAGILIVATLAGTAFEKLIADSKRVTDEKEKVHWSIIATTRDASGGSDTVRLRQATVHEKDGSCTTTVQRYVRGNLDNRYAEPPTVMTFPCVSQQTQ